MQKDSLAYSFETPVKVESVSANSRSHTAAYANNVYFSWSNNISGSDEVYFASNTGWGLNKELTVSNNSGASILPSISAQGSNVYLTWTDSTSGNNQIYFARSTDSGATFDKPIFVSDNKTNSSLSSISAQGSNVYLTWTDSTSGNNQIYFARSTDSGATFDKPIFVSDNKTNSSLSSISAQGSNVYLTWTDSTSGNNQIYFARSTDSGATFDKPIFVSDNKTNSSLSSISAQGSNVYLTWTDSTSGNNQIYFARSTDSGATFDKPIFVSDSYYHNRPQMSSFMNNIYILVEQRLNSTTKIIQIIQSHDFGSTFKKAVTINSASGNITNPTISISGGGNLYLTWFVLKDHNTKDLFFTKALILRDPNLKVELVVSGLSSPTTMAFLGPNDFLILEKDIGTVRRVVNGVLLQSPLLDVNVATFAERGMLGIAVNRTNEHTYVFLYYSETEDADGGVPIANRLYRYELINNELLNPKILLNLPILPGPCHNSGAIGIGPDGYLYVPVGDVCGHVTLAQNNITGQDPDGTSGILRVDQDGNPPLNGTIGNQFPANLYFAYGIRNSFGFDFDPLTGKLWDGENAPGTGDELNLVEPGFNSGWSKVSGKYLESGKYDMLLSADTFPELVNFGGKGRYSDPEFMWKPDVGITGVKFLNSSTLGSDYENDLFIGDIVQGNIYRFDLDQNRTGLSLSSNLIDKVANGNDEWNSVLFGQIFGGVPALEIGPDGYLYAISLGQGKVFRIVPNN